MKKAKKTVGMNKMLNNRIQWISRIILLVIIPMLTISSCSSYKTWQKNKADYGSLKPEKNEFREVTIVTDHNQKNQVLYHPIDQMISTSILKQSVKTNLHEKPVNDIMIDVAKSFLGTEYVGFTLDREGDECLVLNLRGLDCTTYLENVVVLSRLIKQGKTSFEEYARELIYIRYRGGKLDLYPSRLHYFADWLYDNEKKGVVTDITKDLGGMEFDKEINFMTQNRDKYKHLSNDEYFQKTQKFEQYLSLHQFYYIPETDIERIEDKIHNGDLIALTSTVDGLDIAHVTIAIHQNNRLHIIHASSALDKVIISVDPLADYVKKNKSQSGIMVGRLTGFSENK